MQLERFLYCQIVLFSYPTRTNFVQVW